MHYILRTDSGHFMWVITNDADITTHCTRWFDDYDNIDDIRPLEDSCPEDVFTWITTHNITIVYSSTSPISLLEHPELFI